MITIEKEPSDTVLRAYDPTAEYVVKVVSNTSAFAKVQFFIADDPNPAIAFGTEQTLSPYLVSGTDFYFSYSPSPLLQSYFENEESWGALGAQAAVSPPASPLEANTGFSKRSVYFIRFTAYETNGTSPEHVATDSIDSDQKQAINARADTGSEDNMLLPFTVSPTRFLNHYPKQKNSNPVKLLCPAKIYYDGTTYLNGTNLFLSFFCQGDKNEATRLQLYNGAGVLIATHFIEQGNTTPPEINRVRKIAVGPANLNSLGAGAFVGTAPTQPVINDTVAYYEIRQYIIDKTNPSNILTVSPLTQTARVIVERETRGCEYLEMHFCNEFGAEEIILLRPNQFSSEYRVNGANYTKTAFGFPSVTLRGATAYQNQGQKTFTIKGRYATVELEQLQRLWLSPNIALVLPENPTQYVRVVRDGDNILTTKAERGDAVDVEFQFLQASKDFSQRN